MHISNKSNSGIPESIPLNSTNQTHTHQQNNKTENHHHSSVNLARPDSLFNSLIASNTSGNAIPNINFDNIKASNIANHGHTSKVVGTPRATGYYPANSRLEGGFVDKQGHKLYTLQQFLSGKAPYVSIALDKKLYANGKVHYGDKFSIPELEKKYGKKIEFRAVDTGGAFTGKGFGRVDICTGSEHDSSEKTINGKITLIKS
ncbi:MAG: hypothetical protein H7263_06155 [Candidatus Sericytochromatia bacterium]|nr:hypothetical protein [Candidatus Sericytochromatia bacterium]